MKDVVKFEFDGLLVSFRKDGWIHATPVAAKFGKEASRYLEQLDTVEYGCALSKVIFKTHFAVELNEIKELLRLNKNSLAEVKTRKLWKATGLVKSNAGSPEAGGGTWIHPKMVVPFARWLSVDFAVNLIVGKCDE